MEEKITHSETSNKGWRIVKTVVGDERRSGYRVGVLGTAAAGEEDQRRGRREVGNRIYESSNVKTGGFSKP
jgi:hypothetical protein